ncbi:hypothetical protein GFB49_18840 [Epibacterium sp. SM1979]|uniref:Core-binding (CB) domain-containing protein n=1 Tax=Tritonibacter litoralis TaxID=2662264 RepID=A0A843YMW3_9RHOB|nr:hypothetical protein [Tritonibacter litoralis]MQQ10523.1 hypothetical protein [Tritonibacter litoralis]
MTARPRKGRVAAFSADDGTVDAHEPSSVTGLRFSIVARSGGTAQLDFTDLRPRPLAIDAAQAIRRLAEVGGPLGARSTVMAYANTVRIFFAFLASEAPNLTTCRQIEAAHIDGFEDWLDAEGKSRVHAFTILSKAVVVFREIDADQPDRVSQSLRDRLRYTNARPFERPRSRDAYSPFVARQLRDAARADVAMMMRRIDGHLPETLIAHTDPVIRQRAVALHEAVARRGFLPRNDKASSALYRALYSRGLPTSSLLDGIYARFYLTVHDLPPLLTLLSLDTGLEIECVKALKTNCLSNASAGTVTLRYTKRRAHGLAQKAMRVRDGGPTTPGGLIRAIVKMTQTARQFESSDALFVFYHACGFRSVVRHPKLTLSHWIARHGIVDDDGHPLTLLLSRLRKTHKALWYLKTSGHMARFAVGHSVDIAARHYADIPSLRPLHEATVVDALEDAIRPGAAVTTDPVPAVDDSHTDTRHCIPPQGDGHVASADIQDVWLASCSGFYDSPFSSPGAPCSHPFWGCLDCRNAVISERKLPAILGFLDFIVAQRAALGAEEWAAKFGHVHARITQQVLPSFPEEVIATARASLAVDPPPTYLPPEATQ